VPGPTGGRPLGQQRAENSHLPVQLLARRKTKVAAVALANKHARMIWTMMAPVNAIASRRSLKEHGAGHCA
jgi:hypothetical protein